MNFISIMIRAGVCGVQLGIIKKNSLESDLLWINTDQYYKYDWVPERPKTRKAVDQKGCLPKKPYQKGRNP